MFRARIIVKLKPDVMDPQGQAILEAASHLGFTSISDLRVGRYFEMLVDQSRADEASSMVAELCDKLLANPVIETYEFQLEQVADRKSGK
jgi:phosphoribosylformylglycinamidine synthase